MNQTGLFRNGKVLFLNPRTCGVHKSGGVRYRVDAFGHRTREIDNELFEHVISVKNGRLPPGACFQDTKRCMRNRVLVPRYYDKRWNEPLDVLIKSLTIGAITVGELISRGILTNRCGHGSPGNDQRNGTVPYIKVSDIRNLRININPTNMIPLALAKKRFWHGDDSGLKSWDLVTPIRASSNIGEFAILLPGEERVVLTKETMVFRINEKRNAKQNGWDAFYLLWALSLRAVRNQWQRIALMQTNREDIGERFLEIRLPMPPDRQWADTVSAPFRDYFEGMACARKRFIETVSTDRFDYIGSICVENALVEEPEGGRDETGAKRRQRAKEIRSTCLPLRKQKEHY